MIRHIAANAFSFLIVLMLLIGGLVYWGSKQISADGPLTEATVFTVKDGTNWRKISQKLATDNVIKDERLFRIALKYQDSDRVLKVGEYKIPAKSSIKQVIDILSEGKAIAYKVTIPEGYSNYQVVERLMSVDDLDGKITDLPNEGWLAPNTYFYQKGDDRQKIIDKMADAQIKIIEKAWENRAKNLPVITPKEALILASIIEKETGIKGERRKVASVFINRLRKKMKLQTDPTVIYGITKGEKSLGRGLRKSELAKKTPYNTYVIEGLPPTPIANPGKAAIEAALNPVTTEYIYFVADGTGGHVFASSLEQHNKNVVKWRKIEAERKASQAN